MGEKKGIPPCMLVAMTRRRALKSAALAAGVATAAACGTLPGEFGTAESTAVGLPPQTFSLDDPALASLLAVGGVAYLKIEEGDDSVELAIVRAGEDELLAFNNICPHAGLDIIPKPDATPIIVGDWLPDERALRCNWHSSVFRANGEYDEALSSNPGTADIAVYAVTFDKAANEGTVTFSG